jgi:hypothetical protein
VEVEVVLLINGSRFNIAIGMTGVAVAQLIIVVSPTLLAARLEAGMPAVVVAEAADLYKGSIPEV